MVKKSPKQIIGQSLISPISAPQRIRQTAWSPPETPVVSLPSPKLSLEVDHPSPMIPTSAEIISPVTPIPSPKKENFVLEPMDIPDDILPCILKHLKVSDLCRLLTVSKQWATLIFPLIYSHISLSKFNGQNLKKLNSMLSLEQSIPYKSFIKNLSLYQIFFANLDEHSLCWKDVKQLLSLCHHSIEKLLLELDDRTFLDLALDYQFLDSITSFSSLTHLTIKTKNSQIPEHFIIEFLRKCSSHSLLSIHFVGCLDTFTGTSWYLLHDKISPFMSELTLTPCLKTSGWDSEQFQKGFLHIVKTSAYLEKVDISAHKFGLCDKSLNILLELSNASLRELSLPCGLNDSHLICLMSCTNIGKLRKLDLSCKCATGRFTEIKPNGWPCNKFTDSVLIALLEKFMGDNKSLRKSLPRAIKGHEKTELILPRFVVQVTTGKKVCTLQWAAQFRGFQPDANCKDAIFYKGFRLYSPGAQFIA